MVAVVMVTVEAGSEETQYAEDDLTDDRVQNLLMEATQRLRTRQNNLDTSEHHERWNFPKLDISQMETPYVSDSQHIAKLDAPRLLAEEQRRGAGNVRNVQNPKFAKNTALQNKKAHAGKDWYNLPKTELTPELKRDLQLLKMRSVLNPHRHYKKDGGKMEAPRFSQVGTIVEGPTEFFSGRIDHKQRKRTLVAEVLAGEQETGRFRRKYGEVQDRKTSGKKAFYNALKAKRKSASRKNDG